MIHILKAPFYLCEVISVFSTAIGQCLGDLFTTCGLPFADICNFLAKKVQHFCVFLGELLQVLLDLFDIKGPLGGLNLLSLLFNIPSAYFSTKALMDPRIDSCGNDPLFYLTVFELLSALINLAFASYLKRRLNQEIALLNEELPYSREPMSFSAQVGMAWKQLALYDVGVALYFFFYCFTLGKSWIGIGRVSRCDSAPSAAAIGPWLQVLYTFAAFQYLFWWGMVTSCLSRFGRAGTAAPAGPLRDPYASPTPTPATHPLMSCHTCHSLLCRLLRIGWRFVTRSGDRRPHPEAEVARYEALPATAPAPSAPPQSAMQR
mmetsp:Transcript_11910/g.26297  ORF Transcript_11910/g.26297 Transcript_11910/m.26297 type:complete len:319 (+) Transcript_11910:92-1048(+)